MFKFAGDPADVYKLLKPLQDYMANARTFAEVEKGHNLAQNLEKGIGSNISPEIIEKAFGNLFLSSKNHKNGSKEYLDLVKRFYKRKFNYDLNTGKL